MTQLVLLKGGPKSLNGTVVDVEAGTDSTEFVWIGTGKPGAGRYRPPVFYRSTGTVDEVSGLPVWKRTKGPAKEAEAVL